MARNSTHTVKRKMGAVGDDTDVGNVPRDGDKAPKEVVKGDGWGAGAGPPSALAYDSDEERLKALAPKTDAEILMEQRKQKAQKMIAKKPGVTLNPRKVKRGARLFRSFNLESRCGHLVHHGELCPALSVSAG